MTKPQSLSAEFIMQIRANIEPVIHVGDSDHGKRQFIPITGGTVTGERIQGEVLPGADWQLLRNDGVLEIEAIYAIRTHDQVVINVKNIGIVSEASGRPYVRTQPRLQAPQGNYDWMNKRLFLSTITAAQDRSHVLVDVFEVC